MAQNIFIETTIYMEQRMFMETNMVQPGISFACKQVCDPVGSWVGGPDHTTDTSDPR